MYSPLTDDDDTSTSTTSSVHVPGPCFSVYELRNKLFQTLSPNAVYIYTYKNQIKSFKLPIHWVGIYCTILCMWWCSFVNSMFYTKKTNCVETATQGKCKKKLSHTYVAFFLKKKSCLEPGRVLYVQLSSMSTIQHYSRQSNGANLCTVLWHRLADLSMC